MPGRPVVTELNATVLSHGRTIEQMRQAQATNRPPQRIGDGIISALFLGLITNRGPNPAPTDGSEDTDKDDETSPRYWVKLIRPLPTLQPGDQFDGEVRTEPNIARTVRATNLAEIIRSSHALATDETCVITMWRVLYQTVPTTAHWIFDRTPGLTTLNGNKWADRVTDNAYLRIPPQSVHAIEFSYEGFTDTDPDPDVEHPPDIGANLRLVPGTAYGQGIFWNPDAGDDGMWLVDYPRLNDDTGTPPFTP